MIKKIEITKQNKTIPENFILELGQITVITGENNSGKTNFINEIIGKNTKFVNDLDEEIKLKDEQIIYIKAENIKPSEDVLKHTAKTTWLVESLSKLFSNINLKIKLDENISKNIKKILKNTEDKTNINLESFTGCNTHKININPTNNELDSKIIIQSFIDKIVVNEEGQERNLNEIGQGTQRLIILSVLKAYMDVLLENNSLIGEQILILFEEPEIYLHPKLKRTLNSTLEKIASFPNHQVIITTHDPYFVFPALDEQLNKKIFSFQKNNGMTEVLKEGLINGIEDELLFIFLYSCLEKKQKKHIKDVKIGNIKSRIYVNEKGVERTDIPDLTYIRHQIHHSGGNPNTLRCGITRKSEIDEAIKNNKNFYTQEELSEAIQQMSQIIGQK
ncbi:MAG: ATP-dependent old family endonuclease [Parcubacteria group bacterium Athens0714_16]|nr:MAG: ATP-dependent old family endonuclease [Parcubacteria group bacterium Athens0714_16]